MRPLAIIGVGGLGRMARQIVEDLNRVAMRWQLVCYLDDDPAQHGRSIDGTPVAGGVEQLFAQPDLWAVIAIARTTVRRRIATYLGDHSFDRFATLIHPWAWVGHRTLLGSGSIVYPGAMLDSDVQIGAHAVLNKGCTVGHDAVLADFVTLAPGVNIGGAVHIGEGVDMGIGSCTIQGVSIGSWSIVGAGAAVIDDLSANVTAVGVPARVIKQRTPGWHT